jgi:mannose/fructose/N-acetylgalactosamine-specific phosphotransferase system component IID
MIAVIASILGVIVLGGLAGYFLYRRYTLKMIAQKAQGPTSQHKQVE